MRPPRQRLARILLLTTVSFAAGCSMFQPRPTPPPPLPPVPSYDLVASIRAAGAREKSVIDVNPLRNPAVTDLRLAAQQDEQAGRYADAANKLDLALKVSPDSPDLLQDRAEVAVWLKDFPLAEKLAYQSWSLGPKLGPLCARNWQTIVEMRLQKRDQSGAATAQRWVRTCHKADVPRY